MKTNAFLPVLGFLALLLAGLSACDEGTPVDPNAGRPVFAEVAGVAGFPEARAGDTLRVDAGQTVEVAVRLTDARNEPVEGWEVAWTPDDSSRVSDARTVTGPDGVARTGWTMEGGDGPYTLDAAAVDTRTSSGPVSPRNSPDLFATTP